MDSWRGSSTVAQACECVCHNAIQLSLPPPTVVLDALAALEASLLNTSGNVPLHNRFRALFTLKALKNDDAVKIISKGEHASLVLL